MICARQRGETRARSLSRISSPETRSRATISAIRTVFQTSTAFDSRLRQLALFIISSRSPVRNSPRLAKKRQPAGQIVAMLAVIKLELYGIAHLFVIKITENEDRFDDLPQGGQGPRQTIRRGGICQPLDDDVG